MNRYNGDQIILRCSHDCSIWQTVKVCQIAVKNKTSLAGRAKGEESVISVSELFVV